MTENLEDEEKSLNNPEPTLNKGVELLLRRRSKQEEPEKPKTKEELVVEKIDNVIASQISTQLKKSSIPRKQPWLEMGLDYYLMKFPLQNQYLHPMHIVYR